MSEFNENNQDLSAAEVQSETVTENPQTTAAEPQPDFINNAEVVAGVEIEKKNTGKIIGIIIAAILLIFGCCFGAYALIPQVKNTVKMLINSPEDYYAWVENENADEFSWLFDSLDEFEELNVNSKCTYEINTDAINAMLEENKGTSLTDNGVNLPSEISMEVKGADIDGVYTLNEVISSGDSPVLNYNLYFKDGGMYIQIPELSSSYLCLDIKQILTEAAEQSDGSIPVDAIAGIFDDSETSETAEKLDEIVSEEKLQNFLVKYSDILFSSAENVKLEKNFECEASGVKAEYTNLKVTIDEGTLFNFAKNALKELKNEEMIIDIIEAFDIVSEEEYKTSIEELSDQLEMYEISGGEALCVMNVMVNNKGEIVGRTFEDAEQTSFTAGYIMTNDDDNYGFSLFVDNKDSDEKISLDGSAVRNGEKFTGSVAANNGETVLTVEFKDFEFDDEFVKGDLTLKFNSADMEDVTLSFDNKDGKQLVSSEFVYNGEKLYAIKAEVSTEKPDTITVFNNDAKVYNISSENSEEAQQYLAEANTDALIESIIKLFGIDPSLADELINEFTFSLDNGGLGNILNYEEDGDFSDEEDIIFDEDEYSDFGEDDPYAVNTAYYDLSKCEIKINNQKVTLPCKLESIVNQLNFDNSTVEPEGSEYGYSDDYSIMASVYNNTSSAKAPAECDVISFSSTEDTTVTIEVDGITYGDDIKKVAEKYGCEVPNENSGFIDVENPDSLIYECITFYYDNGKIYEIDLAFYE